LEYIEAVYNTRELESEIEQQSAVQHDRIDYTQGTVLDPLRLLRWKIHPLSTKVKEN
jgi:hypothetical protein